MPIDKFHPDDYVAGEYDLLEYVIAVADKVAPDFAFDSEGHASATDSQAPVMFMRRYNRNLLSVPLSYNEYIGRTAMDDNLIDIIEGLEIDPERFWYLLLFISDYVVGSTFNTFKITNSPRQDIESFIGFVKSNEAVRRHNIDRHRAAHHLAPYSGLTRA